MALRCMTGSGPTRRSGWTMITRVIGEVDTGGLPAESALDMGMPAEKFGRIHHLPAAQLAAVIDGIRDRGLIGDDGCLSEQGRAVKQRVEALTDDLAAKPYESLEPGELGELMATLEPLAALLLAAQDW